jgi:hypothetical protein
MATWSATTFCTAADVRTRAPEIDAAFNLGSITLGNDVITQKIALAKDLMRQHVVARAQSSHAATVQSWLEQAQSLADRKTEQSQAEYERLGLAPEDARFEDAIDAGGAFSTAGRRTMPQTFTNSGTPTNGTSGTQATFAENGARLVDTKYSLLYINRGTLASPTWERFTSESMIDYIANPTELKHANVVKALELLYEDRVHRFDANHDGADHLAKLGSIVKYCRDEYQVLLDSAWKLLQFDASNDGTVDDFERGSTRSTTYFA